MNEEALARSILGLYLPLVTCFRRTFSERTALSLAQFRVLALIHFESVHHVGKLAERNLISQPAMSKMVDALVNVGYVKRGKGKDDRRRIELHVTTKGRAAMSAIYDHAAKELVPRLKRLSAKQQMQIAHALGDMAEALSQESSIGSDQNAATCSGD